MPALLERNGSDQSADLGILQERSKSLDRNPPQKAPEVELDRIRSPRVEPSTERTAWVVAELEWRKSGRQIDDLRGRTQLSSSKGGGLSLSTSLPEVIPSRKVDQVPVVADKWTCNEVIWRRRRNELPVNVQLVGAAPAVRVPISEKFAHTMIVALMFCLVATVFLVASSTDNTQNVPAFVLFSAVVMTIVRGFVKISERSITPVESPGGLGGLLSKVLKAALKQD